MKEGQPLSEFIDEVLNRVKSVESEVSYQELTRMRDEARALEVVSHQKTRILIYLAQWRVRLGLQSSAPSMHLAAFDAIMGQWTRGAGGERE